MSILKGECRALPDSWLGVAIQDIAKINPGWLKPEFDAEKLVHFVPMASVVEEFGGIDVSRLRLLSEVQKGYTAFVSNDVLFAKITPCMENGKVALVPHLSNALGFGSTEFHVLRGEQDIEPRWLAHYIAQAQFRRLARQNMTGSAGQMRVPTNWLSATGIPLAPAAEQTRIVEKLEELLSDLDAGVAEFKVAQKKLIQYRQSLLKAAVEGALTADWRAARSLANEETETGAQLLARILTERRSRWETRQLAKFQAQGKTATKGWQAKYPEPVAPDSAGLPALPLGWVWASLDMLSEIQGGIQKQPSRAPIQNMYSFLRVANVARGLLKLDEVHKVELFNGEPERLVLQKGDLLIVEGNGSLSEIGRCAVWDGSIENTVHQNHLIRARPVLMESQFIETWLNSLRGIEKMTKLAATTSGLYTLSVGKISKIPVPVPSLIEQRVCVGLLDSALEQQKRQLESVGFGLKQSAAQRKNILQAAFSGQLVPQDPADEPASALLARIRVERAGRGAGFARVRGRKSVAM